MKRERFVVRSYGALVKLYPRHFRNEYGTDMVLLFREQCSDESAWRVFARVAVDLAITIPSQHLETRMRRTPSPLVPLLYLALSAAGLVVAIAGGTNRAGVVIGLCVALGAGVVGVLAWRRAAPIQPKSLAAGWWKFVVAGPCLIALVIVAAGVGVEAWFLGIAIVLAAFVLTAIGIVLAGVHLLHRRSRPIAV